MCLAVGLNGCCDHTSVSSADATTFLDAARTFDFSCSTKPAPTTAANMIFVSGVVEEIYQMNGAATTRPVADAMLQGCNADGADCLGLNDYGSATSAANGTFMIGPAVSGGMPIHPFVKIIRTGDRTTHVYPATPLAANVTGVRVLILQNAFVATLAALGISQDASKTMVGLQMIDCADMAITDSVNITPIVKQGGNNVAGTTIVNAGMVSPMFAGGFFILNVPPGPTEVGATYKGMTMLGHTVVNVAGTTTATQIRPGY